MKYDNPNNWSKNLVTAKSVFDTLRTGDADLRF